MLNYRKKKKNLTRAGVGGWETGRLRVCTPGPYAQMGPGEGRAAHRTGGYTVQRQTIMGWKLSLEMEGIWGDTARGPWMQAKKRELSWESGLPTPAWLERKGQR